MQVNRNTISLRLGFTYWFGLNRIPGSFSSSGVNRSVAPWFSRFRRISDNRFSVASSVRTATSDLGECESPSLLLPSTIFWRILVFYHCLCYRELW